VRPGQSRKHFNSVMLTKKVYAKVQPLLQQALPYINEVGFLRQLKLCHWNCDGLLTQSVSTRCINRQEQEGVCRCSASGLISRPSIKMYPNPERVRCITQLCDGMTAEVRQRTPRHHLWQSARSTANTASTYLPSTRLTRILSLSLVFNHV
jgi:hypothetical protein